MVNFINEMFQKHGVGCKVALGGSFPLRVYLPESDLDVVVLTPQKRSPSDSVQEILEIFSCLCETIRESEQNLFPYDFVVLLSFLRYYGSQLCRSSRFKVLNL